MSTRSSNSEPIQTADDAWMSRALALASRGAALAHPNPTVGAVLVKNGKSIGEGFHKYDRRDHAEIVALKKAGVKARGATLYVTLEPCCTTGRTGPCTNAVIEAGVKRVVVAMQDPNANVAGRGNAQLRRAGIDVTTRIREDEARRLNEGFAKWISTGLPFVTLKTALTLDGRIASRKGSTTWITSEQSLESVQRLRHEADALLTGIGTVLIDNPRMGDRTGQPRRRSLLRAIVDSRLRLPLKSELVKSAQGDVIVYTTQPHDSPKARALERAGIDVVSVPARGRHVDLQSVMRDLGNRQILNVILEAGAELNGAALQAGIVDKMILFYAPKVMGPDGVPMAKVSPQWFAQSPALQNLRVAPCGTDFVVEGYLADVYGNHRTRRKN
ncbi:MAG TPA: bifunctional diaminohydroxyphosphoribosylaminopyrimidine deaminase/5-amino-6-(5-phosphoribosylamino)uracil reductase RibD [Candidatus Dormibacteraeota bacterium]|nr:bifunctional diaminohydroxyphosphoribosylaminopyrimidine deaminase/5-amino-6-(5-phosphoribosylamino)uracil reductase RibD [Candidatus Dormibacteraeota bacterium]